MIYGLVAMGIALIVALGYAKIEHSGKLEAEAQLEACGTKIVAQNAAVQQLKVEGDRRVAAASKGVLAARKATARATSEAQRLRVAAAQPGSPGASCPAGEGVAEVRKGLGK